MGGGEVVCSVWRNYGVSHGALVGRGAMRVLGVEGFKTPEVGLELPDGGHTGGRGASIVGGVKVEAGEEGQEGRRGSGIWMGKFPDGVGSIEGNFPFSVTTK